MHWTEEHKQELRDHWNAGYGKTKIAHMMGVTIGSICGASRRLNLQNQGLRGPVILPPDHRAMVNAKTLFPHMVVDSGDAPLKSGAHQRKLSGMVTKGEWRGNPIYSLSLEERATCPRSCKEFATCYGNSMPLAKRMKHGEALEDALWDQLYNLNRQSPFVVRLHLLGDFYSVDYVHFWHRALKAFHGLRIFGYTAWQRGTPVGDAVEELRTKRWKTFAVRTSGAQDGPRTIVIDKPSDRGDAIICPVETGRATSCGTCSLCWASKKPVAFLRH